MVFVLMMGLILSGSTVCCMLLHVCEVIVINIISVCAVIFSARHVIQNNVGLQALT